MTIKKFIGTKSFYKTIMAITIPIIIQNGITNFVNLLDNVMVGLLGTEQLSGVGIANQLIFVFTLCLFGGLSGAGIFTAQFFGKGDREGLRCSVRFKLYTALIILAIGGAILIPFGESLITLFLNDEDTTGNVALTLHYGREYLKVALIALVPMAFTQVYASTLRETGQTVPPMVASIVAVATNALFNWLRIEDIHLPNWMVYNVPDGLWLFSYLLFIESIWDDSSIKWLFVWGMVLFAYALEILQFANIFPGTGDVCDIFWFSLAILLYLSIYKLQFIFHEKFY